MAIIVLFDLWPERRLIKYEGIEARAERPQFYNAKFRFKFYIDRVVDFENKCKEVVQFYHNKAWIDPVT